jgi:hypothetical protein
LRLSAWSGLRPGHIGVLLSAAGMFLGYDLGSETARLLGGEPGIWARMTKGAVWGGVIAALQWPVVRSAGVLPLRFVVASAVGFAVGYPLGQTIQLILTFRWSLHWTGYVSALATFGLCLALPQWWAFRRQIPRASLWSLFSMAGWMLSGAAWSAPPVDVVDSVAYGMVAGLGLVWLVRSQRPVVVADRSDERRR